MLSSRMAFCFSLLVVLCSCSTTKVEMSANSWINEGSIVIAGPVPEASSAASSSMLAFMPSKIASSKNYLTIDRASSEIRLMNGAFSLKSFKVSGLDQLPDGDYEILLKQNNALWYANDEYFTNRGLSVPPAGDKARYLRGALGSSVIYIDEDIAIHDGPSSEVGGIILDSKDMQEIYKLLEVGTQVVVK